MCLIVIGHDNMVQPQHMFVKRLMNFEYFLNFVLNFWWIMKCKKIANENKICFDIYCSPSPFHQSFKKVSECQKRSKIQVGTLFFTSICWNWKSLHTDNVKKKPIEVDMWESKKEQFIFYCLPLVNKLCSQFHVTSNRSF